MNKNEFLGELRHRLKRLPEEEIANAISYYEEYINEAGESNEAKAIADLGGPGVVAAKIIGEYAASDSADENRKSKGKGKLWIVILAICASPIAIPIVAAIVMMVVALGISVASLILAAATFLLGGVIYVFVGIWALFHSFATGLFYMGAGLIVTALGLLSVYYCVRFGKFLFERMRQWMGNVLLKIGRGRMSA